MAFCLLQSYVHTCGTVELNTLECNGVLVFFWGLDHSVCVVLSALKCSVTGHIIFFTNIFTVHIYLFLNPSCSNIAYKNNTVLWVENTSLR